ncbi:MAG: class I SAM-dependent methyltransferase [Pseudomonadota bacterium]
MDRLRDASNACKAQQYQTLLTNHAFHLELAIGRGGDVLKLAAAATQGRLAGCVGIDCAPGAIEEAARRAARAGLGCRLFVCDLCTQPWGTYLVKEQCPTFDSVGIQFAFHYMVRDASVLRHVLEQIARVTNRGAVVFGTTLRRDASYDRDKIFIDTGADQQPCLGRVARVRIPGLVEGPDQGHLAEHVVDWAAVEPVLHDSGFYLESLAPVRGDPLDAYLSFVLRRFR